MKNSMYLKKFILMDEIRFEIFSSSSIFLHIIINILFNILSNLFSNVILENLTVHFIIYYLLPIFLLVVFISRVIFLREIEWLRKNSRQGSAREQYNLGVAYANGQGVVKSIVSAHMWLSLAALPLQGNEFAARAREARDAIEKGMTQLQIEESEQGVLEWVKRNQQRRHRQRRAFFWRRRGGGRQG